MVFKTQIDNPPLPRPGLYRIVCVPTGKCYVGAGHNLLTRSRNGLRNRKLAWAISRFGIDNFIFQPLAYSIDDSADWLNNVEREWIKMLDAVASGFNMAKASASISAIKLSLNSEKTKAKHRATTERPDVKAKLSAAGAKKSEDGRKRLSDLAREQWRDPIARVKLLEARAAAADRRIANMTATMRSEKGRADAAVRMKAKWENPEIRSRILDGMQKAWDDPETRRGRIARRWSKTQKEE
jgi:group I intron endonuclease